MLIKKTERKTEVRWNSSLIKQCTGKKRKKERKIERMNEVELKGLKMEK